MSESNRYEVSRPPDSIGPTLARLIGKLSRCLDGRRTRRELVQIVGSDYSSEEVYRALRCLDSWELVQIPETDREPIRWSAETQADTNRNLLRLLEGPVEALLYVDFNSPSPLTLFAGFPATARAGRRAAPQPEERMASVVYSGCDPSTKNALLSCLGEAAEHLSSRFRGDEPLERASFEELTTSALHPGSLLNVSDRQYLDRDALNAVFAPSQKIPEPFSAHAQVDWVKAYCSNRQDERYVPAALVFDGYVHLPGSPCFAAAGSSGTASGESLELAMLAALLELVEHDAAAIWWYNRTRRPRIELALFKDDQIDEICEWFASHERQLHVLEISSDIELPVVVAVCADLEGGAVTFGLAAHWQLKNAVLSAISELFQILTSTDMIMAAQSQKDAPPGNSPVSALVQWRREATLRNQSYLAPAAGQPVAPCKWPTLSLEAVLNELEHVLDKLADRNLHPWFVDLTRTDLGVPAVRAFVPGLRSMRPRFGPGRLYEVPFSTGERSVGKSESDLNPIPIFI